MTTLHERALILAREIAAHSLCRREAWLPGVKAGIYKEIIDGKHDDEPLVQGPFNAILRTTELAAAWHDSFGWELGSPSCGNAIRGGAHLKKATTHD